MSQTLGEIKPSTHDVIWIATSRLLIRNKTRDVFSVSEIFKEVNELELPSISDSTIKQHISSHCVANTGASPDTHRKLFRVDMGFYRLYRPGDLYFRSREGGKIVPAQEMIPEKYRYLITWYENEYCKKESSTSQETSPYEVNPPYVRIDQERQIKIPYDVSRELDVVNGDYVCFIKLPNGTMQIKKVHVSLRF